MDLKGELKGLVSAGVKVAVRSDREAGVIRASITNMDGSDGFEIATLKITMADDDKQLFEEWHRVLAAGVVRLLQRMGLPAVGYDTIRLRHKN